MTHNVPVDVELPTNERKNFLECFCSDGGAIMKALTDIDTENKSKAAKADDCALIHRAIREGPGFPHFNAEVKSHLREWFLKTALELCHGKGGGISAAKVLFNAASNLEDFGNYERALQLYQEAVRKAEAFMSGHHFTADIHNNMAMVYKARGEYDEALRHCERAREIRVKCSGDQHQDTVIINVNKASVLSAKGDYDEAMKLCEHALGVLKKAHHGQELPDMANVYYNMAMVRQAQQQPAQAQQDCQHALDILKATIGHEHASVAVTLQGLALIYKGEGKLAEALQLCERALAIRTDKLGERHPSTATTFFVMAGIKECQQQTTDALELYRRALDIMRSTLGEQHPNTALCRGQLGLLLCQQHESPEKWLEGRDLVRQCVESLARTLGSTHPDHKTFAARLRQLETQSAGQEQEVASQMERQRGLSILSTAESVFSMAAGSDEEGEMDGPVETDQGHARAGSSSISSTSSGNTIARKLPVGAKEQPVVDPERPLSCIL